MIDFKSTAIIATVAALWGQIQSVFSRIRGLVIVKVEIQSHYSQLIMEQIWATFRQGYSGNSSFIISTDRVKKLGKYQYVVWERPSKAMTFWKGITPLMIAATNEQNRGDLLAFSYIRGTIDFKQLLLDSVDRQNSNKSIGRKFNIVNKFGNYNNNSNGDLRSSQPDHPASNGGVPVGYTINELGQDNPLNPFSSLYLDEEVEIFVKEVKHWHGSKEWFNERNIPWKMPVMLTGKPGTGKSSLVRAICQDLDIPIHVFDLPSMSNQELTEAWKNSMSNSPVAILLEDVDRVFTSEVTTVKNQNKGDLTLDCLLNLMSGVGDSNGVLIFITANFPERLDAALTRPGRIDKMIELKSLTTRGRVLMSSRILFGDKEHLSDKELTLGTDVVNRGIDMTGAEFQKLCTSESIKHFWENT